MKTVFKVDGGIGRELWFTGLLQAYKDKNPDEDIIVLGAVREVFDNLKFIKFYPLGSPNFFDDILLESSKYYDLEPYNDIRYLKGEAHAIEIMAEALGLEKKVYKPIIKLNSIEDKLAKEFYIKKHREKKKIALFQAYGSSGMVDKLDPSGRSLAPDEIESIHKDLTAKGYDVYYIGKDVSQAYSEGLFFKDLSLRQIFSMVKYADLLISMDSFLPTVAQAFNKTCITMYKATLAINVGFEDNINIECKDIKPIPNRFPHGIVSPEQRNVNEVDIKTILKIIK